MHKSALVTTVPQSMRTPVKPIPLQQLAGGRAFQPLRPVSLQVQAYALIVHHARPRHRQHRAAVLLAQHPQRISHRCFPPTRSATKISGQISHLSAVCPVRRRQHRAEVLIAQHPQRISHSQAHALIVHHARPRHRQHSAAVLIAQHPQRISHRCFTPTGCAMMISGQITHPHRQHRAAALVAQHHLRRAAAPLARHCQLHAAALLLQHHHPSPLLPPLVLSQTSQRVWSCRLKHPKRRKLQVANVLR